MAVIAQAIDTIPLAEAVPVIEPSAPPIEGAPDNPEEWPPVKVYGANFVPDLINLKKTIDILELWDWMKNNNPPDDKLYVLGS